MTDLSYFPYPLREHQGSFASYIQREVRSKNVVVNAATGFGKTPAILAALLPLALRQGQKIIWAVRTGNETDRPVEELKVISGKSKRKIFGLSYRGKRDMCLLLRDLKLKGEVEYDDVSFLCKSKQKECRYLENYERWNGSISSSRLYSEILEYCEEREICPYKFQGDLVYEADVVALNYNYVIDEAISWAMRKKVDYSSAFLVVDEAHNLQNACSNLNSQQITLGTPKHAAKEIASFTGQKAEEIKKFLERMQAYFRKTLENLQEEDAEFSVEECIQRCSRSLSEFEAIIRSMNIYGGKIRKKQLEEGKAPRSSLHRLANFWSAALANLNEDGIAFIATKEKKNLVVELWDMRSSVILRERWKNFYRCIFCSGTIKPVDAFAETVGLENYSGKVFPSPFTGKNVLSIIAMNLTTEGIELSKEMAENYLDAINEFLSLNVNAAIFSASYRIQSTLLNAGLKRVIEKRRRKFFLEQQGMSGSEGRRILDGFKECGHAKKEGVLCATMTGRFAEGADFPGKELEAIFLAGIPFERMSTRTKLYLDYYQHLYGKERGTFLGYVVPALRRASQSLGRALRSREDRAIFVLGDKRYKGFISLLPDFVQENYKIVEDAGRISEEAEEFWR